MVMYMNKEWIRPILFFIVSFVLLVLELVFLLFVGNDLYSRVYNYELGRRALLCLYGGFPIAIVATMNRLFEGEKNYHRKAKNLYVLIGIFVVLTIVYNATIWKTDYNFDGMVAIIYCIWLIICNSALIAYYLNQSKKFKLKS